MCKVVNFHIFGGHIGQNGGFGKVDNFYTAKIMKDHGLAHRHWAEPQMEVENVDVMTIGLNWGLNMKEIVS